MPPGTTIKHTDIIPSATFQMHDNAILSTSLLHFVDYRLRCPKPTDDIKFILSSKDRYEMQTEKQPKSNHAQDERGQESPNGITRPAQEERSDDPKCRHCGYDVRTVHLPELG